MRIVRHGRAICSPELHKCSRAAVSANLPAASRSRALTIRLLRVRIQRLRGLIPRPAAAILLLRAPIPRRAIAMAAVDPAAADTAAVAEEVEVAAAVAAVAVAEAPAEAGVPSPTAAGTNFIIGTRESPPGISGGLFSCRTRCSG